MGCQKSQCKLCKKWIKGKDHFSLMFKESDHTKEKHPKIFSHNKKIKEEEMRRSKELNDWLIKNEKIIFTQSKWDGEDMTGRVL